MCSACQDGYYKDNTACTQCNSACATCETSVTQCTSCSGSKYLKSDGTCVSACENKFYANPQSNKCISCSDLNSGITDCDTCTYDTALQGPKCTACTSSKIVKEETNRATTCILASACTQYNANGPNFLTNSNARCALCSNVTDTNNGNKGVEHCKTCQKTADGTNPTCSACLDGYFFASGSCTATCGTGCATCSAKDDPNKCSTCMAGSFLVGAKGEGQCVSCGDTAQGDDLLHPPVASSAVLLGPSPAGGPKSHE